MAVFTVTVCQCVSTVASLSSLLVCVCIAYHRCCDQGTIPIPKDLGTRGNITAPKYLLLAYCQSGNMLGISPPKLPILLFGMLNLTN